MKPRNFFSGLLIATVCTMVLAGCRENEPDSAPTATPAAPVVGSDPAPGNPASPQNTVANLRLAEAQTAMNSRDYETAATALLAAQQTPLTAQQAEALATQMQKLQSSLASALASGDPRAQAAAEKLRRSATVR